MAGTIAPFPKHQFFDNVGAPAAGYKLFTYAAGTTTKTATYTDVDLTSANTNPIVLDSAGRCTIYLSATSYKFVLAPSTDTDPPTSAIWTQDNVAQVPTTNVDLDVAITAGENLAQNDCAYLSAGDGGRVAGRWYKTDADLTYASSGARSVGIVLADVLSAASGTVRVGGRVTGLSALTAGAVYYVSATAGALTSTAPTNERAVGVADSTTSLVLPALLVAASATESGVVTIGAQTIAGAKTFSGAAVFSSTVDVTGVASFAAHPRFEPGASTGSYAQARGLLNVQYSTVPNSSTTETTGHTYDLPANALDVAGRVLKVTAWGTYGATANTKTIRFYVGSNSFTILATSSTSNKWNVQCWVVKTGSSTQDVTGALTAISAITGCFFGTATATDTAAITLKTTIQDSGGGANEITAEGFLVEVVG